MVDNTTPSVLCPAQAAFDDQATIADLHRVHFIGIGGAGMSVLAEMLHEEGVQVSGCDRERNGKTDRLTSLGITVALMQDASHVDQADLLVYSSAIKPDNPEIVAAKRHGIPVVHRSDILSLLLNAKRGVTVAGAHGKTTTSSLLAHILANAGTDTLADPSYAIGGSIQANDGKTLDGGHAGQGSVMVAEADESDGSFEKYHPYIAIVTNAEPDHLDHYGTAERYHQAFAQHIRHARGYVIACVEDEGVRKVLETSDASVLKHTIVYGFASSIALLSARVRGVIACATLAEECEQERSGKEHFMLDLPQIANVATLANPQRVAVELMIPGIHNALNAAGALVAATLLGVDGTRAAHSAATFRGASRRFDIRGNVGGVTVVDDYAHHPTEIAAMLRAARRRYPHATLHVLFQPHLFSRTQEFAQEFAQSLALADDCIVTGIYPAREKQEDFPTIHASTIVKASQDQGFNKPIEAIDDMHEAAVALAHRAHRGDVLFTVGAGSVTTMASVMLETLSAREG